MFLLFATSMVSAAPIDALAIPFDCYYFIIININIVGATIYQCSCF